MSKRLLIGIALVVMSVSVVGAASYTSASVTRGASIDVKADQNAIIGLEPGDNVPGVTENSGKLSINLDEGVGLNNEATFAFGDTSSPDTVDAFAIRNNGNGPYDFSLSYTVTGTDSSSADNVQFEIYDSSGAPVDTVTEVTENSGYTLSSVGSGDVYYVVIVVDTTGLSSSDDLSGTLTISASSP